MLAFIPAFLSNSSVGLTLSCKRSSTPVTHSNSISRSRLSITAATREGLSLTHIRAALYLEQFKGKSAPVLCSINYKMGISDTPIIYNFRHEPFSSSLESELMVYLFSFYILTNFRIHEK